MIFEVLVKDFLDGAEKNELFSLVNGFEDGKWRYPLFNSYIWDNIGQTSLTAKERESLVNHSLLVASAKNLRLTDKADSVGEGSELAEIILYGIMKDYYNALSVVPKIFYKQNPRDNAKGSDSVHVVIENEHDFSLWFGEAKFYNSIEDARLNAIIKTVETSLQTEKLKKENSIITNLSELDTVISNKDLCERIRTFLSGSASIDDLKPKLHVPILVLHECLHTKKCTELTDDYRQQIKDHHRERAISYFAKQAAALVEIHKITDISFHIILLPIPEKTLVVERFIEGVKYYKNQA